VCYKNAKNQTILIDQTGDHKTGEYPETYLWT
jgi:hypothetical protein